MSAPTIVRIESFDPYAALSAWKRRALDTLTSHVPRAYVDPLGVRNRAASVALGRKNVLPACVLYFVWMR